MEHQERVQFTANSQSIRAANPFTLSVHARFPLAVLDLDNCLFDDQWRLPKINQFIPLCDEKYDDYHAAHVRDSFVPHAKSMLIPSLLERDFHFIVCTGRTEKYRQTTMQQLEVHYPEVVSSERFVTLIMRPDGDTTPTAQLKIAQLKNYLENSFNCVDASKVWRLGVDDRNDVLNAYASAGWNVLQCSYDALADVNISLGLPTKIAEFCDSLPIGELPSLPRVKEQHGKDNPMAQDAPVQRPKQIKEHVHAPAPAPAPPAPPLSSPTTPTYTHATFIRECMGLYRKRNAAYCNSREQTADIIAAIAPCITALSEPNSVAVSVAFNAAMVKLTQFANSDFRSEEALSDFMGYITQIGIAMGALLNGDDDQLTYSPKPATISQSGPLAMLDELESRMDGRAHKYSNAQELTAKVIQILRPSGTVFMGSTNAMVYHLFEIVVTKVVRFAQSNFTHVDSIFDCVVVSAMMAEHVPASSIEEAPQETEF